MSSHFPAVLRRAVSGIYQPSSAQWNLFAVCVGVSVAAVFFLFYWNRFLGWLFCSLLRLLWWKNMPDNVWIDCESLHISLIAGRIILKDFRYHTSNQSIRGLKCFITWRYWLWRTQERVEPDISGQPKGEEDRGAKDSLPCRVHIHVEGIEWFMYNRMPMYNDILARLSKSQTAASHSFTTSHAGKETNQEEFAETSPDAQPPTLWSKYSPLAWIKRQWPTFDFNEILPIGFSASRGAILLGNPSTPTIVVAQFRRGDGTYGIAQCINPTDLYRQVYTFRFQTVSIRNQPNPDYRTSLVELGMHVVSHFRTSTPSNVSLSFADFRRFIRRFPFEIQEIDRSEPIVISERDWHGLDRFDNTKDKATVATTQINAADKATQRIDEEISRIEYAAEPVILDTPLLEVTYYVDVPGPVMPNSHSVGILDNEPVDIGNGGLSPQWRVEIAVTGGTLNYGPWADRSRSLIQKVLSPPSYLNSCPAGRLHVGETRVHVCLEVFIRFSGLTTLNIPTRQPSQDWRYDRTGDLAKFRTRRTGASLACKIGDGSTINYVMPMVANDSGFPTKLTVSLADISITSSFNDSRFLSAERCRITCALPTPLRWNEERQWTFDIVLNHPTLHLLRDHVTLLTDLGKDWSSGPPVDPPLFIPMIYLVRVALIDYNLFFFLNDHNIVNFPFAREGNSLLRLNGSSIHSETLIPSNKYRPESTTVSFWVEAPNVHIGLSLPNWNTHTFHDYSPTTDLGTVGFLRVDASYLYFSEVRNEHVERLKFKIQARGTVYKCFGWSIRHFMIFQTNYFGSFTNYSTVAEYLTKRNKSEPIGDPIDLKYRPGKSNVMEVMVDIEMQDSIAACPEGLPGYERYERGSDGLGGCLVIQAPEMQLHLRLHDYSMELSFNIQPLCAWIDPQWVPASATFPLKKHLTILSIDGIDIIANRLFGPQPRTTTYLCMWEINVGAIKATLSPDQARGVLTAMSALGMNYSDEFNAPATQYQPEIDPDVTFLKVAVASVHLTWNTGTTALCLAMPRGVHFSSNDLAGNHYRSYYGIDLPECNLQSFLAPSSSRDTWLETAVLNLDLAVDIYSAPSGWRDSARVQRRCVEKQDALTQRATFLYREDADPSPQYSYVHSIFLPHPKLPNITTPPPNKKEQFVNSALTYQSRAESLGSEEDLGQSEADRDARVARSRPATPMKSPYIDESMSSGDESDNDGILDSESMASDSEPADPGTTEEWPRLDHYLNVVRRYRYIETEGHDIPFSLARDSTPLSNSPIYSAIHLSDPSLAAHEDGEVLDDERSSITLRIASRHGIEVVVTPLCVHSARHILPAFFNSPFPSLELQVDDFVRKTLALNTTKPPTDYLIFDGNVPTLRLRCLQSIMSTDEADIFSGIRSPNTLPSHSRVVSIVDIRAAGVRLFGKWGSRPTFRRSVAAQFSQFHLDVGTVVAHSIPQMNVRPPRTPESVFHLHLEASRAQAANDQVDFTFGDIAVRLGDRAPETLISSLEVISASAREVFILVTKYSKWAAAKSRYMIWALLTQTQNIAPSDPLSHTRPSFLVQSGRPQQLRTDVSWKVLDHARFCLRYMSEADRQGLFNAVDNINRPVPEIISSDIEALFATRWRDWTPDLDQETIHDLPLFKLLFPQAARRQADGSLPLRKASLRTRNITLSLVGEPTEENTLTVGPTHLAACLRVRAVGPAAPPSSSLSVNRSNTSHQLPDRFYDHLGLNFAIQSVQLTIFPTFLPFVRRLIQVRRRGKITVLSKVGERPQSPRKLPRVSSRMTCDIVLEAGSVGLMAAAGHFAFDAKLLNTIIISSTSLSVPLSFKDPQTVGGSITFAEVSFQAKDLSGHSNSPLAELRLLRSRFTGAAQQNDVSGQSLRGIYGLDRIMISVPKNAIRLLNSVKEWYIQYFKLKLDPLWQSLLAEIEKDDKLSPPPPSPIMITRRTIDLQISVASFQVELQIWLGSWLTWRLLDTTFFLISPAAKYPTYGLEILSQTINWLHRSEPTIPATETQNFKVTLPTFRLSGQFISGQIQAIALVDFFRVTLKPNYADSILILQQKLGNEFYDLFDWFASNMPRHQIEAAIPKETPSAPLRYDLSLRHQGFRIGIQGPTSTQYLDSSTISASIDNTSGRKWDVSLSNLALSLAHHSAPSSTTTFERKYRSAYMVVDVGASGSRHSSSGRSEENLQITAHKVHAVFHPVAFGELGDLIDHLQAEYTARKDARALELEEARKKVKRTLEATRKVNDRMTEPWLDNKVISVKINSIGVALPLTLEEDIMLPQMPTAALPLSSSSIPAFLFSTRSITFSVQRAQAGSAAVKAFAFQFVPSFDQSIPKHFEGPSHISYNKMAYPEMTASLRSYTSSGLRQFRVRALVSGFELDLDPSITKYVFSLVDVYIQGKERIKRLTASPLLEVERPSLNFTPTTDNRYATLPTTILRGFLEFRSGRVRLRGGSGVTPTRTPSLPPFRLPAQASSEVVGQIDFPMVTVWGHYKATPASTKFGSLETREPSSVVVKATIHASRNQLNPTVLPFLIEVSRNVERRLQRSPYSIPQPPSPQPLSPSIQRDGAPALPAVMQSLHLSFSLRVDQSSLELSCAPDVLVMSGLHWDSGGFVLTVSPGLHEVSFVGAIEGITASLKHKYSEYDCVQVKAQNLGFAVTFSKFKEASRAQRHSVSIVLDTQFSASVDASRLQDILCFRAIWLDRIPVMSIQQPPPTPSLGLPLPISTQYPAEPIIQRPFSTAVLIRFRQINLEADVGTSITRLTLSMQSVIVRTLLTESMSELEFSVGNLNLEANRMLSGYARVEDFVFRTLRRRAAGGKKIRMLELSMTSGPLNILTEYDGKKILLYEAQPLQISIFDDWTLMQDVSSRRQLKLDFVVHGTEVVAIGTVMALPNLIELYHKLTDLVEKAKMEARRDSETFRLSRSVPQTALTEVANAAFKSARSKFNETEWLSFSVVQHMTLRLTRLRLGLFPHTMFDHQINHFDAVDVEADLKRYVQQGENRPIFQDLRLSLASFIVTQKGPLRPHLAFKDPAQSASEWLAVLLKDSSETMIFKMPHMHISMQTEQIIVDNKKVIEYDVDCRSVSTETDVYITLNSSMIIGLRGLLSDFLAAVNTAMDGGSAPTGTKKPTTAGTTKKGYTSDSEGPSSPTAAPGQALAAAIPSASRKRYIGHTVHISVPRLEQLGDTTETILGYLRITDDDRKRQIPLWVHEYAMTPMSQIMKVLLELYTKQLSRSKGPPNRTVDIEDDELLKVVPRS